MTLMLVVYDFDVPSMEEAMSDVSHICPVDSLVLTFSFLFFSCNDMERQVYEMTKKLYN